jgi:hypothetical protein
MERNRLTKLNRVKECQTCQHSPAPSVRERSDYICDYCDAGSMWAERGDDDDPGDAWGGDVGAFWKEQESNQQ